MNEDNTQMTPTALDVLEKLSGWTEITKFKTNFLPQIVYTSLDESGVMCLHNDNGAQSKRLEHMDIDGKVFVRDPQ